MFSARHFGSRTASDYAFAIADWDAPDPRRLTLSLLDEQRRVLHTGADEVIEAPSGGLIQFYNKTFTTIFAFPGTFAVQLGVDGKLFAESSFRVIESVDKRAIRT